jgi:hypothetical protein
MDVVSKDLGETETPVKKQTDVYWSVPFADGLSIRRVKPRESENLLQSSLLGTMTILDISSKDTYIECTMKFIDLLNKLHDEYVETLNQQRIDL